MFSLIEALTKKREEYMICWVFNMGLESQWREGYFQTKEREELRVRNHMEETLLLLARSQDIVIMRQRPSQKYIRDLKAIGFEIPVIWCVEKNEEKKSITELILEDQRLLVKLKKQSTERSIYFVPYEVTEAEERLAFYCGMNLVGSSAELSKRVNNRIFARKMSKQLRFSHTKGTICYNMSEMEKSYLNLKKEFPKVVVKQPSGGPGKGIYLIESDKDYSVCEDLLSSERGWQNQWIMEGWYESKKDYNMQIYITPQGEVSIFSIKERLFEGIDYKGNCFPIDEPRKKVLMYCRRGIRIGKRLYQMGARGIIGIDSIFTDEEIFPLMKINLRLALSTYTSFLENLFPNSFIQTGCYPVSLKQINYDQVRQYLKAKKILLSRARREGVTCYTNATLDEKTVGENGCLLIFAVSQSVEKLKEYITVVEALIEETGR